MALPVLLFWSIGNKEMEDITQLIDELETEFAKGKNFLWSKKSFVNLDKCEELILELKQSLPTALQEASYVLSQRDKIISQAKEQAEKTLKEAETRAEQLVSESSLIKKSENEATEMMESAEKRSSQLYNVTKENIDKLLKSVEDYLLQNLHVVRSNREELNNSNFLSKQKK